MADRPCGSGGGGRDCCSPALWLVNLCVWMLRDGLAGRRPAFCWPSHPTCSAFLPLHIFTSETTGSWLAERQDSYDYNWSLA